MANVISSVSASASASASVSMSSTKTKVKSKEPEPSCSVCCEILNKSNHSPCVCPKCEFVACKTCVRKYLESDTSESHCMSCKYAWDDEFVLKSVNKTYFHSDLKEQKKQRYFEVEKSKLAESQDAAKDFLNKEKCEKLCEEVEKENKELMRRIRENKSKIVQITYDFSKKSKKERKAFIMRCQLSGCNGFISQSYKCELCENTTCSKCFEIQREGHECKKEDIDTAELIKKDSRPCPTCATRISKIDGCPQMWCTNCHNAFDWNTGQKVVGTQIHNPHFYEYLKQAGNGVVPRNPGDVMCGGLPNIGILGPILGLYDTKTSEFIRYNINNMHRMIGHFHYEIQQNNRMNLFEQRLEDAHVQLIIGRMTEAVFRDKIWSIYIKKNKVRVNCRLLETVEMVGTDLLQRYFKSIEKRLSPQDITELTITTIKEFHTIIDYYNSLQEKKSNLFKEVGMHIKVIKTKGNEDELNITQIFNYQLRGMF
jgi:hypothetical protein